MYGLPKVHKVANLYMEHLEETALRTAPGPPRLWLRCVDDAFVIWLHGKEKLDCFHEHLSMQHRNIKFTVEHEKENKLAFLDVQVTRTNNRLTTSVYRKSTHTDGYIPFHSHYHQRTVTGVLRCIRDRANKTCDPTSKQKEFQHLQTVLQANGFPAELVRKTLSHQTRLPPPQPVHEDPAEPQKIMCLPYIRGLSERIERICTPLGAKAAFKPAKTLRQTLMNIKNCISEEKKRELVYEVPCKEWHLSRRW